MWIASSVWADRVASYVRDVAVPCGLARMVLVGSAFTWRRATGERETCWCKLGVSLVSGMIGGIV